MAQQHTFRKRRGPGRVLDQQRIVRHDPLRAPRSRVAQRGRVGQRLEALDAGLVTRVVDAADALATIRALAGGIAAAPPLAMQLTRDCIERGVESDPAGALAIEILAIDTLLQNADWKSTISNFGTSASGGSNGEHRHD
ncbi:enoyl-CoA hydratase/isomerase family protein [Burkholderia sp. LMG 13014]|uniref:enoyl-CoA hydratase/isomerase family protein n=1 Tax=Burkholderia sp. LMG 13014 TaxID=2709306 RepID=UPI001963BF84|nr:hypothetical protein [Burkholderia sp. LMG 13014]